MAKSIFSTYSTPENRVTSTILAVFEKLNYNTVASILQILMEDSTIELIEYENQVSFKVPIEEGEKSKTNSKKSVPDGRIRGSFDYIIETKIVEGGVDAKQIKNHCKAMVNEYTFSKLLVLTPDSKCPENLKALLEESKEEDKKIKEQEKKCADRVIWSNFAKLVEGIDTVLDEPYLLFDRESFLLLELKEFIIEEGLLPEDYTKKVLIIPAGTAWGKYQDHSLYKCQPNRSFQKVSYMGFYAGGVKQKHFPKILGYVENLNIQTDNIDEAVVVIDRYGREVGDEERTKIEQQVRERLKNAKKKIEGGWNDNSKYIILSSIDSPGTFVNKQVIENDKKSYSGKRTAFVQRQTYSYIEDLEGKEFTSEL